MRKLLLLSIIILMWFTSDAKNYHKRRRICKMQQLERQTERTVSAGNDWTRAYRNQWEARNTPILYKTGKAIRKTFRR